MSAYPTEARAVVLTADGIFYDNGHTQPLPYPELLSNLPAALSGASKAFWGGEGVLVIDGPPPTERPVLDWRYSEIRPWTSFGRGPRSVVHVLWLERAEPAPLGPLLDGHQGPADIAARLGIYHKLTGTPWHITSGVTGCSALRNLYNEPGPGRQPLWHSPGVKGIRGAGPLIWRSPLVTLDSDDPRAVVMYDVNAAYLAALKNAPLAWGALEHTGSTGFDPDRPGYWEIAVTDAMTPLLQGRERPPVVSSGRVHKNALWVSTQTAKYLESLVGSLDVLDSWTSGNGQTIARPYAERLARARLGLLGPTGPAELAIKRTYAELVGMMARPGGSIHRTDWASTVMDLARMNLLRRLDKIHRVLGVWPFEVRTDAAYYLCISREQMQVLNAVAMPGDGPGMFKKPRVFTVPEYLATCRDAR
jgi:hypothetical protein